MVTPVSQVGKPRTLGNVLKMTGLVGHHIPWPPQTRKSDRLSSAAVSWWVGAEGERWGVFVFEGECPTPSRALMGSAAGADVASNAHGSRGLRGVGHLAGGWRVPELGPGWGSTGWLTGSKANPPHSFCRGCCNRGGRASAWGDMTFRDLAPGGPGVLEVTKRPT